MGTTTAISNPLRMVEQAQYSGSKHALGTLIEGLSLVAQDERVAVVSKQLGFARAIHYTAGMVLDHTLTLGEAIVHEASFRYHQTPTHIEINPVVGGNAA